MDVWVVNHMDGSCIGVYTTLKKAQAVYEPLRRGSGDLGPYVPQLISLNTKDNEDGSSEQEPE